MPSIFQKIRKSFSEFTKKMDEYQVELTFAEMGIKDVSTGVTEQVVYEEKSPETLLVIGSKGNFSEHVINYAIDMADRMSYNILALSTSDLSCETLSLFKEPKDKLCQDFKALADENSKIFAAEAEKAGISFSHIVLFENVDDAVETVTKSTSISFVVDSQIEGRVETGKSDRLEKRPEDKMFVYSVI